MLFQLVARRYERGSIVLTSNKASPTRRGGLPPDAFVARGNRARPGVYLHVRERRVTEWPVKFLSRPRRTADTIPAFLAPDAPSNRLEILRGLA